jgi:type VI protein secretion system component Hcp
MQRESVQSVFSMRGLVSASLLVLASLGTANAQFAAYLDARPEAPGCTLDRDHEDQHEVVSYEHGLFRELDTGGGGGGTVGRLGHNLFSFVTDLTCSVVWRSLLLSGTPIDEVVFSIEKVERDTGRMLPFFTMTMTRVVVVSVEEAGVDQRRPEWERLPDYERIGLQYAELCWVHEGTDKFYCSGGNPPLAVQLVYMEVLPDGQDIHVRWGAVSDPDVVSYDVLHRHPGAGEPFRTLRSVPGKGGYGVVEYNVRIAGLSAGRHEFRLAESRADGSTDYSDILEVEIGVEHAAFVLSGPYPNPVRESAVLRLGISRQQHVDVSLYDLLGRRVGVLQQSMLEPDRVHEIPIRVPADLAGGAYIVVVSGPDVKAQRLLTVVR